MLHRPITPFRLVVTLGLLAVIYLIYTFSGDPLGNAAVTKGAASRAAKKQHPKQPLRNKIAGTGNTEVAVLSMTTKEDTYLWQGLVNKLAYCRHHDYDLYMDFKIPVSDDNPDKSAVWHKLTMLEYVEPLKYDWIWWADFDTLVTNMTMKIEDIARDALRDSGLSEKDQAEVDLIAVKDCSGLNAGSLIFRGDSPRLKAYIRAVLKCKKDRPRHNEQECFRIYLHTSPEEWSDEERNNPITDKVPFNHLWVAQRIINIYPEEIRCYDKENTPWKPGQFMMHFAGAWAYLKDEKDAYGYMMRKYRDAVIPAELREAAW